MERNAMSKVVMLSAFAGSFGAFMHLAVGAGGFGGMALGYLAPLPLFLIAFWAGATAAALAGVIGAILTAVLTGSVSAPLLFLASAALPPALTAATAWRSGVGDDAQDAARPTPGDAATAMAGVSVFGFFLAVVLAADEDGGLKAAAARALTAALGQLSALGGGSPDLIADAAWSAPALPGVAAASWMLMAAVNGALAQGVGVRFGFLRRPPLRLTDLTTPRWSVAAFAAAVGAGTLLPDPLGFWGLNLALISATVMFFAGLATVHAFVEGRKARPALLVAFYGFLFIFGWPIALLVGLGVIETWTGLGRRLRARRSGLED